MSPPCILVVDDEPAIREAVALALQDAGYAVEVATNGQEALGLLAHTSVALIVLDMRMPVLDGWGLAQELRAQGLRVPILVMTAATNAERWAAEIQAEAVLAKPFAVQALLDQVGELTGGPEPTAH